MAIGSARGRAERFSGAGRSGAPLRKTFIGRGRRVREQAAIHASRAAELERRGRCAEAVACYREALRHDPGDPRLLLRLGLLLRALGRDEEANRAFEAALALTAASSPPGEGSRPPCVWDLEGGTSKTGL
jgi:Flp pilus assembly protein TadD